MLPSCSAAMPLPWSSPFPLRLPLPLPFAGGRVTTQGCSSCHHSRSDKARIIWSRRHSAPPMGPHCIIEVSNVIRWNFVPNGHGRHVHKEDKVSASASASHMGYACRHTHTTETHSHTLTHTHTHLHTLTHSNNADCTTLATSVSARSCKLFQMACRNALLRGASIRYAAKLSACKSQSKPIYNASQSNHLIILHAHMLRQLTHSTDHVSQ